MYGLLNNLTNFVCWDKKSGHSREVAGLSGGTTVVMSDTLHIATTHNNSLKLIPFGYPQVKKLCWTVSLVDAFSIFPGYLAWSITV